MKEFLESRNLLQTIASEAGKNDDVAQRLAGHLSEQQLNWKPAVDQWSIAQCLDHLAVTGAQFDALFNEAIERGRQKWPVTGLVQYLPSLVGGWLIRQIVPENGRRVNAPKVFKPSNASTISGSLDKFLTQEKSFLEVLRQATGLDYNKTRLRSPVTWLMRYSLADAFVITVVHGRRHLAQAGRVVETPGFPHSQN